MIKRIFIYWNSGFTNAPEIVKKCLLSWKIMNPSYDIIELDDNNLSNYIILKEYIPNINNKDISKTVLSNIIGISLLYKYGGFWCDATVFCTTPLNEWIDDNLEYGFFAYNKPRHDLILASWFLYGIPNNIIIQEWFLKTIKYWNKNNSMHTYFWFHYLFDELYNENTDFKNMWDKINKISADLPHYLQSKGLLNDIDKNTKEHIDNKISYMYKLIYKIDFDKFNNNCILEYIYNKINIKLIHIGKCGGTTIRELFSLEEYHCHKPLFNINEYYILWLRNPIHRFVSAFNMSYHLIILDTQKLDINNLTLENCIAPNRVKNKIKNKNNFTFSKEYDELINYFQTANNLAESLTSKDNNLREKALKLMNHDMEHINKGIGWYLENGEFIKKHHKNIIFVGKIESMKKDIIILKKLLNIDIANKNDHIRKNNDKNIFLSDIAIKNIIDFYKETDYKALHILYKYSLIDEKTLKDYYIY